LKEAIVKTKALCAISAPATRLRRLLEGREEKEKKRLATSTQQGAGAEQGTESGATANKEGGAGEEEPN
jgi:hypothetical protein